MAKSNKLTETRIKAAKPTEKPYKLRDERGLYLLVTPAGGKLWRLRYLHPTNLRPPTKREIQIAESKGKTAQPQPTESMLSLGAWPDISLDEARDQRDAERKKIAKDIDPAAERRASKLATANTFEAVARECIPKKLAGRSAGTVERAEWMLQTFVYPYIGSMPLDKIEPPDVLAALRRVEARGRHETAKRTRQRVSMVFRYGVATGRCKRDITADLDGALTTPTKKHHAAITDPAGIGELLRAIDGYTGHGITLYALKLAPYLFVRPGELRHAEWSEIDLDSAEPQWLIPAAKMKARRDHLVPLASQVVAMLRELRLLTGPSPTRTAARYVFPALTTPNRPMSENTENTAIRRLGYSKEQMTAHGFRSLASTRLNEGFNGQRFESDHIEMQLAHYEGGVRGAYNRAKYLTERRKMMQAWADYLDSLRAQPAKAVA
jgi:integrase